VSRRGWLLFALIGLLWGVPYLFMKVAVGELSTPVIVFARLVIGAAMLLPIAFWEGSIRSALPYWRYITLYALLEMVGPWYLITSAQKDLSSGVVALLVATVPIWATLFAHHSGDTTAADKSRLFGIAVGLIGIALLVGIEGFNNVASLISLSKVLLAAVLYAWAVNMVTRKVPGVSGLAINGIAMFISAVIYLPFALNSWPTTMPSNSAILSTIALGIFSTGLAFWIFFKVLKEIGAARASLVVYPNTAVAVVIGIVFLSEKLTLAISVGLPLVMIGSYYASRKPRQGFTVE
jgi:drug/metabolite transporter (DMT)-like permease